MKRTIERRDFLKLTGATAAGLALAGCTPAPTEAPPAATNTPAPDPTDVPVPDPIDPFADQVDSGALPAMADRMPTEPVVVGDRDAIGVHGGEVRMVNTGWNWFVGMYGWLYDTILAYSDQDLRTLIGNIFESWEMSADGTTYTFYLREGMKWSDGMPFTTADVQFWWEDFATNSDLGYAPWQWSFGGEDATVDFVDEYTFTVTFVVPFGQFAAHLTRLFPGMDFIYPKHYMSQFHATYTDEDTLNALVEDAEMDSWQGLFYNRGDWGAGVWQAHSVILEYPVVAPWMVTEKDDATALYQLTRNPYYWKVDEIGSQLPYLDAIRIEYVATAEGITQKLIQGETDYVGPHDVSMARYPLYKENEESSNYVVADLVSCMTDRYVLFPQQTPADEGLAAIVQNSNFVKALSVAIDRDEINESLYFGLATMGQLGPMPNSKYYKPEYGTAYAQYDETEANRLLDDMGLDQVGDDGYRLRPDGTPLTYTILHAGERVGVAVNEFCEMVASYWQAVGINTIVQEEDEDLITERMRNGELDCTVWHADRCTDLLLPLEMNWYLPLTDQQGSVSVVWQDWYYASEEERAEMEAPPEYMQQLFTWHDELNSAITEEDRVAAGQNIFDYLAENPIAIGTVLECPAPVLFNKNMRNLPKAGNPIGWDTLGVSVYRPEAFFYEGGERAEV